MSYGDANSRDRISLTANYPSDSEALLQRLGPAADFCFVVVGCQAPPPEYAVLPVDRGLIEGDICRKPGIWIWRMRFRHGFAQCFRQK